MRFLAILFLLTISIGIHSQVDTLLARNTVNSMQTREDHTKFWKQVHADDQGHRGKHSNDSIDLMNLVKCSYYLNAFGYPVKAELGGSSQIIGLVWIHNRFPQLDLYTFPIILEGFRSKQINEDEFRGYYVKTAYKRKFSDRGYEDLSISELLAKLNPRIERPIDIRTVLALYELERALLNEPHEIIGTWHAPEVVHTFYVNGKMMLNHQTDSPIQIFRTTEGVYYYQRLHEDRSHYPQKLTRTGNTFRFVEGSGFGMEILDDDSLKVTEEGGPNQTYTPGNSGL